MDTEANMASGRRPRWATVRVVDTGQTTALAPGRSLTFGRGGSERRVDVVLADLKTLSRVAMEITLREDAVWVRSHQRRGGVVELLLPGGHLLAGLREGHEMPVHEVVFRVRVRVDQGAFDVHVEQNAVPDVRSGTGSTQSTRDAWRPEVLLAAVPGEDWRRVIALACAMAVYPHGAPAQLWTQGDEMRTQGNYSRPAPIVAASGQGWTAQVPAFKQLLTVCGRLFGGKPSPKWLSDRLDKALLAFGLPADNSDKLARLVPLVLRIGVIDDMTMLALAGQIDDVARAAHLTNLSPEPSGVPRGDRER